MKTQMESISIRTYTPAEVETVAGVSTTLQREWRRRGVLPAKEDKTWSRVTTEQLICISTIKFLADGGMNLNAAGVAAHWAAPYVLERLIQVPEAVQICAMTCSEAESRRPTSHDTARIVARLKDGSWYARVQRDGSEAETPPRYLMFGPDFHDAPDPSHIIMMDAHGWGTKVSNMVVATRLDLQRVGEVLLERSGSPLVVAPA
jgi:hypothetical protein